MIPKMVRNIGLVLVIVGLAACSRGEDEAPILMNIQSTNTTPDEFAILPGKPIQIPDELASLPAPTPGGTNITDPTPRADAVAALGGDPDRVQLSGGFPSSDNGVVAYSGRYGVSPEIRSALASEDLTFRQNNNGRLLERWFSNNVYFEAYEEQSLDQHDELERFRRAGITTVSAPPDPDLVIEE